MAHKEVMAGKQLATDGTNFTKFQRLQEIFLQARDASKEASAFFDIAKDGLDAWMKEHKQDKVVANGYRCNRTATTTRRLDTKALRKDHHDLCEQFMKITESVKLTVTKCDKD